jgi:hypothetical protein
MNLILFHRIREHCYLMGFKFLIIFLSIWGGEQAVIDRWKGPKVHWMWKASKCKVTDKDFLHPRSCCVKGHGPLSCKDELV